MSIFKVGVAVLAPAPAEASNERILFFFRKHKVIPWLSLVYDRAGRLLRWGVLLALLGGQLVTGGCTGGAPASSAPPTAIPQVVRASGKVVADGVVVPVLEASRACRSAHWRPARPPARAL